MTGFLTGMSAKNRGLVYGYMLAREQLFIGFNLPALQFLSTGESTAHILKPTWLVLQPLLTTNARSLDQEWTFRAVHIVGVAVVLYLRVPAWPRFGAAEPTFRSSSPTRLWRLENRPTTCTADFLENCFQTTWAGAFVADLLAGMVSAFERTPTNPDADMLCLDLVLCLSLGLVFSLRCQSLRGFSLTLAASLDTLMTSTVQLRLTCPGTPRVEFFLLIANRGVRCSPASTWDLDLLFTLTAGTDMASIGT
jgi:hypothetical protein